VDYGDVLKMLVGRGVRFAVAGGFACVAHGVVRVTMDLDLVVEVTDENLERLWDTLSGLGLVTQQPISRSQGTSAAALSRLATEKNLRALSWIHPDQPFVVVDLLVGQPLTWSEDLSQRMPLFGVETPVLRRAELIRQKRAAGREKDLVDVRELEKLD
jgi:hypothetical protein